MPFTRRLRVFPLVASLAALLAACSSDTVGPNRAPVAQAGPDLAADVGQAALLDGSGSYDPDGDELHFQWEVITAPAGATGSLSDERTARPSLELDRAGPWLVELVVSDGRLASQPDVVRVFARAVGCDSDDQCDDGIECTVDSCDLASHRCRHQADDGLCADDGLYCNGDEYCDAGLGCQHRGDPCAGQVCDEDGDRCVECVAASDCDDGIDCTMDDCDLSSNSCTHQADDGLCTDDGVFCNGDEYCDTESGCAHQGNPCLGQGLVCDEATTSCVACQQDADCDDGFACTSDSCQDGTCQYTADDAACADDGNFCNGPEVCRVGEGCVSEGDPCVAGGQVCDAEHGVCASCGDGIVSTAAGEECDPGAPQGDHCCRPVACLWVGEGMLDPQNYCSGAGECQRDACDGSGGCLVENLDAGDPCGNSSDSECDNPDSCDGAGNCLPNHEPSGAPCGDQGVECHVDDTCDGNGNCNDNGFVGDGSECGSRSCQGTTWTRQTCQGGSCSGSETVEDCDDGNECTQNLCSATDGCSNPPVGDGTPCSDDGAFCTGPEQCQGGACQSAGNPCNPPSDCDETNDRCGACGDGVVSGAAGEECDPGAPQNDNCCDPASCQWVGAGAADPQHVCDVSNPCQEGFCDAAHQCGVNNLGTGTPCGDSSDSECDNPDSCDGAGNCLPNHESSGAPCGDQGVECHVDDTCDGNGNCNDNGFVSDGSECGSRSCQGTTWTRQTCQGGSCSGSETVEDCDDGNECTQDLCDAQSGCDHSNYPPGTSCGSSADTDCDNPDSCDGAGNCLPNLEPSTTVCRAASLPCDVAEYCDGVNPDCPADEVAPGTVLCRAAPLPCDVAEYCDGSNKECPTDEVQPNTVECRAGGECDPAENCDGTGKDCPPDLLDPNGTPCTDQTPGDCLDAQCDGSGNCDQAHANETDGTPCSGDAIDCTDDICQGGSCISTANDANCGGNDLCVPACALDTSGCVTPPDSLLLYCEDPVYLDLGADSNCTITLSGGDNTGQAGCLSCAAAVASSRLDYTDFEDDSNPGNCAPMVERQVDGWTIVPGVMCYGTVANNSCPMGAPETRNCCDNFACPTQDGEIAFQADRDTCVNGDRQWRLQRAFDTTGLTDLELCFDYSENGATANEIVQVDLADGSNYQTGVFCQAGEPRPGVNNLWTRYCVDLSAAASFADDNPALVVIFFVHSNDGNDRVYLKNITLRGVSAACAGPVDVIGSEDFTGCADPLADGFNGWSVTGTIHCGPGFNCFDASSRAKVNNTSGTMASQVDLSAYSDVELCFYFGENRANGGERLTVEVDAGSGWQQVWFHEGNFGPDNSCVQVCRNLSDLVPEVDHNPAVNIRFSLEAGDHEIDLDHIVLSGRADCAAGGVISLTSPPADNADGTYDFTASDISGTQLTGHLSCQWDPLPAVSGGDDVWWRPVSVNPSNLDPSLLCLNPDSLTIDNSMGTPVIDTGTGTIGGVPQPYFLLVPQPGGAPALAVFTYDSIDISADVDVVGSNALVLLSCHDVNISARINACASGQTGGPGGGNGGGPGLAGAGPGAGGGGSSSGYSDSGGGGAGFGDNGGDGGDGNASGGSAGGSYGSAALRPLHAGSGGGGGAGSSIGSLGGGGGGAVQVVAGDFIHINAPGGIDACGAGGSAPGGDGDAGGGGGSGGAILLEAVDVSGDGTLAANGGGGGAGDDYGGGTVTAEPGEDGPFGWGRAGGGNTNGNGNGGDGGDGGGADNGSGDPGEDDYNAGGGGGSAGRIRINSLSGSSSISATGTISPDGSTGLYTEGVIETW